MRWKRSVGDRRRVWRVVGAGAKQAGELVLAVFCGVLVAGGVFSRLDPLGNRNQHALGERQRVGRDDAPASVQAKLLAEHADARPFLRVSPDAIVAVRSIKVYFITT